MFKVLSLIVNTYSSVIYISQLNLDKYVKTKQLNMMWENLLFVNRRLQNNYCFVSVYLQCFTTVDVFFNYFMYRCIVFCLYVTQCVDTLRLSCKLLNHWKAWHNLINKFTEVLEIFIGVEQNINQASPLYSLRLPCQCGGITTRGRYTTSQ